MQEPRRLRRPTKDRKRPDFFDQQYVKTVSLLAFIGITFTSASLYFGIDITQLFSQKVIGVTLVAAITVLVIDRYKELDKRNESLRDRLEEVHDRLSENISEFKNDSAKQVTQAIRSQINSLHDEIGRIEEKHPWLQSTPEYSISNQSNSLAVRVNDYFRMYNSGEDAISIRLLYDLPYQFNKENDSSHSEDKKELLYATPTDIYTLVNSIVFTVDDTRLSLRALECYQDKYIEDVLFLSYLVRNYVICHEFVNAENTLYRYCLSNELLDESSQDRSLVGRILSFIFGRRENLEAEFTYQFDKLPWCLKIVLAVFYVYKGDEDQGWELWDLAKEMPYTPRKEGEHILFLAECALLLGQHEFLVAIDDTSLRLTNRVSRLLYLKVLAAKHVGDDNLIRKFYSESESILKAGEEVKYYLKRIQEIYEALAPSDT